MWLLFGVFLLFLLWALLPDWRYHYRHEGVITRGDPTKPLVALTFDDGPDPEYTPLILDVLAKEGVKATFFLVGKKAAAHPELVKRIRQEGHAIGNHTLHHRHAWLTMPGLVKMEVEGAAAVIGGVLGEPPRYFRPPWGMFNAFTYRAGRKHHKVVLWTVEARDWARDATPERITKTVLETVQAGDIIDLHDSGGAPGAPARTAAALPGIVAGLRAKGLEPVTLDQLLEGIPVPQHIPLWQQAMRWLWGYWEKTYSQRHQVRNIGEGKEAILRLEVKTYRGEPLLLQDGTEVHPGDLVGEIHIGNERLLTLQRQGRDYDRAPFQLLREFKVGLEELAQMVAKGEVPPEVKAFGGTSLFHRGAELLGFEVREVASPLKRWGTNLFEKWLLILYHPQGIGRLFRGSRGLEPKEVWLSRGGLLQRYGPGRSKKS